MIKKEKNCKEKEIKMQKKKNIERKRKGKRENE